MKHRTDIDGLRSLAVIPVILFHAGTPGFSGGFVGVDIFFVISGFLITTILINDLDKSRFSLIEFYERRARRILPALAVVLAVSTVVFFCVLAPHALKRFAQSLFSVTIFASNFYFYLKSDYFSPAAETDPLLHTWSLAVEEQFYLFFPLVLMFLIPYAKRATILAVLIIVIFCSLMLCQYLLASDQIEANFYLISSRTWELMAGSVTALINIKWARTGSTAINQTGSAIGFALVLASIVLLTPSTPFPGVYAIPSVVGTAMILYFYCPNSWVNRILSLSPFVGIGLISYSLYLWHQPVFAFIRVVYLHQANATHFSIGIIVSFTLAYLSWRYVETPFRNKQKFNRRIIFFYSANVLSVFAIIGLALFLANGLPQRYSVPTYQESSVPSPKRDQCHTSGSNYLKPSHACRYFGDNVDWAVLGDSHVIEPAYALADQIREDNRGLIHLSFSGCPANFTFQSTRPGCHQWMEEAVEFLENAKEIKNVLIGFRYTGFLYDAKNYLDSLEPADPLRHIPEEELYWRDFVSLIDRLSQVENRKIFVLYPIPELPEDIRNLTVPTSIFQKSYRRDLEKTFTLESYNQNNQFILSKLKDLPWSDHLIPIYSQNAFCNNGYCSAIKQGKALYFDDDHPSVYGAEEITKLILSKIQQDMVPRQ